MPLPKPPAKRADFLSRADFDSQSTVRPGKRTGRSQPAGEPVTPAVLELSNEGALPAAPPATA
ncbi:MAG TPA: PhoH family protein, partial [Caldimonas sp.]